jgi:hypothetical protein
MSRPYDIPSTDRPDSLRVRVCPWCGYDRSDRDFGQICSECGHEPRELLDDCGPCEIRHIGALYSAARLHVFVPAVILLLVVPIIAAVVMGGGGSLLPGCVMVPVAITMLIGMLVAVIYADLAMRRRAMTFIACGLTLLTFFWMAMGFSMPSFHSLTIILQTIVSLIVLLWLPVIQVHRLAGRFGRGEWRWGTTLALWLAGLGSACIFASVWLVVVEYRNAAGLWPELTIFTLVVIGFALHLGGLWWAMLRTTRALRPLAALSDDLGLSRRSDDGHDGHEPA